MVHHRLRAVIWSAGGSVSPIIKKVRHIGLDEADEGQYPVFRILLLQQTHGSILRGVVYYDDFQFFHANVCKYGFDTCRWIRVMQNPIDRIAEMDFERYDQMKLSRKYFELLRNHF